MRRRWIRFKRFLEQVAGMEDSPHHLALGLAIGVFVGFLPIMGVQTWVALPLAVILRGNRLLAVAGVWISNPVTFIPFYYLCYRFGLLLYEPISPISIDQFRRLITESSMTSLLDLGDSLVVPLTLGGVALGLFFGSLTYAGMRLYLKHRKSQTEQEKPAVE